MMGMIQRFLNSYKEINMLSNSALARRMDLDRDTVYRLLNGTAGNHVDKYNECLKRLGYKIVIVKDKKQ